MKVKFTVEADPFEDSSELKYYVHARDLWVANSNAMSLIREVRKYRYQDQPGISWEELDKLMDDFWQVLYLPQVDE